MLGPLGGSEMSGAIPKARGHCGQAINRLRGGVPLQARLPQLTCPWLSSQPCPDLTLLPCDPGSQSPGYLRYFLSLPYLTLFSSGSLKKSWGSLTKPGEYSEAGEMPSSPPHPNSLLHPYPQGQQRLYQTTWLILGPETFTQPVPSNSRKGKHLIDIVSLLEKG